MKNWTAEEEELLKEKYNVLTNAELCEMFGRTWVSIYKKARKLGMNKSAESEFRERSLTKSGEKNNFWKGGKKITPHGYVQILKKGHHRADSSGYVMEHIYVFEEATGIKVPLNCDIHHINGNKQGNRITNLCLLTHGAHTTLHNKKG